MVWLPSISTSPIGLRKETVAEVGHISGEAGARCTMTSSSRRESRVLRRIILGHPYAAMEEAEDVRREGDLGGISID